MSVYRRMFGRELPRSIGQFLQHSFPPFNTSPALAEASPANTFYSLGLTELTANRPGLARRHLSRAVDIAPYNGTCRVALALAFESLAQHAQAAEQLDLAAKLPKASGNSTTAQLLCAAGLAHERAGNWPAAAQQYREALDRTPAEPFALHRLVAIELAHGCLDQAADDLQTILAHHPADQGARACLAHLLIGNRRYEQAEWEYEQALCLEPDSWELPLEVSRELQSMQSTDQAIGALERLIAAGPHFPDLRMRLANLYSLRGDDAAACAEYRRALALHPDYLECHIALARHEMRMGRDEAAAEHFRHAIAINNQQVELYVGLGLAQLRTQQEAVATETFASAARIGNNSAVLMAQLGMFEMDFDRPARLSATELRSDWIDDLIAYNQSLIERHPSWNDLRIQQGMLHRLMGRIDEAHLLLREAAMREPASTDALLQLGLAMSEQGQHETAPTVFNAAIDLDPQCAQLQYRLALIYCGELEFDLAMEAIEESHSDALDVQRRIWCEIDALRMDVPDDEALPDATPRTSGNQPSILPPSL